MSQAIDLLIKRLVNIFGEPRCEDPALYIKDLRGAMKGYADDLIELAGDKARDNCKFFPRPAELREFIREELKLRGIGKPDKAFNQLDELPPPTPEQAERARRLVADAAVVMKQRAKEAMGIEDDEAPDVSRPAFEKMMAESPNHHLYRSNGGQLTQLSKKMAGERDE